MGVNEANSWLAEQEKAEMEKRAIIEEGRTPPEEKEHKEASQKDLEDHASKRLADKVKEELNG